VRINVPMPTEMTAQDPALSPHRGEHHADETTGEQLLLGTISRELRSRWNEYARVVNRDCAPTNFRLGRSQLR